MYIRTDTVCTNYVLWCVLMSPPFLFFLPRPPLSLPSSPPPPPPPTVCKIPEVQHRGVHPGDGGDTLSKQGVWSRTPTRRGKESAVSSSHWRVWGKRNNMVSFFLSQFKCRVKTSKNESRAWYQLFAHGCSIQTIT